ncbi:MAG: cupin domain-containing protein [Ruthenibacterium sp.]
MIKKEFPVRFRPEVCGGVSTTVMKDLATSEELYHHGRLFAHALLMPGCSIGWHVHEHETEFYYILRGTPSVSDNGVLGEMHPGEVMVTGGGAGHSIANNSADTVEFLALILQE